MKLISKALFSFMAAATIAVAFGSYFGSEVSAHDGDQGCDKECRKQLAQVRAATAKYHDVDEALLDGYVPVGGCVALPTGPAMGIHYVNIQKVDGELDVREPEILVYAPETDGDLRLVAVEYMIPKVATPGVPELYGRHFHDGPMDTWTLHAWVWRNNPAGMFEDFNSKVNCPPAV
jgi:hypothetical protein